MYFRPRTVRGRQPSLVNLKNESDNIYILSDKILRTTRHNDIQTKVKI